MWINETLSKNNFAPKAHVGIVSDITDGLVTVNSHVQLANVKVLNYFGINSSPNVGQEVLVIPTKDDEYICVGSCKGSQSLNENETVITSRGGGYIKLCENGNVIINGIIITKSGNIITKTT